MSNARGSVYGWVRPLKGGYFQYFAKCPDGYVWGAAPSRFEAAEGAYNYLADHGHGDTQLEQLKPYGKWANK